MIGIIDYGMGNLHSVSHGLERLSIPYILTDDVDQLNNTDGLILPGVGAFPDAMTILNDKGLVSFVKKYTENKPLLGICLGMQLLFEESDEHGVTKGLGLLPGRVSRFSGTATSGERYKVPHMGWNMLDFKHASPITDGLEEDYVYYVHSYFVNTTPEVIVASSDYDELVPGIVQKGNIFGTQFHPEKSGSFGMSLLKNYGTVVTQGVAKA